MNARALAWAALTKWRRSRIFADSILQQLLAASYLIGPDRGFATELFYGVLRNRTVLDFWIDSLRENSTDVESRDLLRLGIYQLFLLGISEHAAVFETVKLASPRQRPLVNGVLRNALRRKNELETRAQDQPLFVRASHPRFLVERWNKRFQEHATESLCAWNNRPAPVYARINLLKVGLREFLAQNPGARSVEENSNFVLCETLPLDSLKRGDCYIQDPSTVAACEMLAPKPGEIILDACGAPGGKTAYLAELMAEKGRIVACDRDPKRIAILRENLDRLGTKIAQIVRCDWLDSSKNPAISETFDRILADVPCSNTGVLRRRVDLRWRLSPGEFLRMQQTQLAIVRALLPFLKNNGVLVYSTCSIEQEENETVVEILCKEFPSLNLSERKTILPFRNGFDGAFAAKFILQR